MRLLADFKPAAPLINPNNNLPPDFIIRNERRAEVLILLSGEMEKVYNQVKLIPSTKLHLALHRLIEQTLEIDTNGLEKHELKLKKAMPSSTHLISLFDALKKIRSIIIDYHQNNDAERIHTAESYVMNIAKRQSLHVLWQKEVIIGEVEQFNEDLNNAYTNHLTIPKYPNPDYIKMYNRACPNLDIVAREYERKHFPTDNDKKAFLNKLKK